MTYNFDNFLEQNPWRADIKALDFFYFPRRILSDIKPHLLSPEPLLIKGARGMGKTALLHLIIKELVVNEHQDIGSIFYFNLEEPITIDFFSQPERIIKFLLSFKPHDTNQLFLIIDESQYLPEATAERLLSEKNLKLIWTSSLDSFGSAVKGFKEFYPGSCNLKDFFAGALPRENYYLPEIKGRNDIVDMNKGYQAILPPYFSEYIVFGGYPKSIRPSQSRQKQKVLEETLNECLKNIARGREGIDEPNKFVSLLARLSAKNGQLLNIRELEREIGLDHRTISRYLEIMSKYYLISLVPPYGGKECDSSPQGAPLVYFSDTGLRNILIKAFDELATRADKMALLDNAIYREIRALDNMTDLGFYRTATGLVVFTFVINGASYVIANRYDFPKSKSGMRALLNFAGKVKPGKVIILTRDYIESGQYKQEIDGVKIIYLPFYWLWALPEILSIKQSTI